MELPRPGRSPSTRWYQLLHGVARTGPPPQDGRVPPPLERSSTSRPRLADRWTGFEEVILEAPNQPLKEADPRIRERDRRSARRQAALYLTQHVEAPPRARARSRHPRLTPRGLTDNFEWARKARARFGPYAVDSEHRSAALLARAGEVYRRLAASYP